MHIRHSAYSEEGTKGGELKVDMHDVLESRLKCWRLAQAPAHHIPARWLMHEGDLASRLAAVVPSLPGHLNPQTHEPCVPIE